MKGVYPIVGLLLLAFAIDFAMHKFIFPYTSPPPVKTEEKEKEKEGETANTTEPDSAESEPETETDTEDEEIPANPKGLTVQDENGNEVPTNSSHVLEDTPSPPPTKTVPSKRSVRTALKGDFSYIHVHIKLWYLYHPCISI